MKNLETSDSSKISLQLCRRCGGLMRLIGSEPHPVQAETDLLTYSCTECGELQTVPLDPVAE